MINFRTELVNNQLSLLDVQDKGQIQQGEDTDPVPPGSVTSFCLDEVPECQPHTVAGPVRHVLGHQPAPPHHPHLRDPSQEHSLHTTVTREDIWSVVREGLRVWRK